MSSLFAARRKPKRIAREEPEAADPPVVEDTGPVVRRPATAMPKTKSKLRVSFNPGDLDLDDTGNTASESDSQARISKMSSSVALKSKLNQMSSRDKPTERPSYSKAYLDELRNSTPSTPRDLTTVNTLPGETEDLALEIESKFGKSAIGPGAIPSAAEIKEKKERRARLAKEQGVDDFIPLEDYDSDGDFKPQRMQVGAYLQPEQEKASRLVPDDEDIAEGFAEFVEDAGRVALSKKGIREQLRKEREQIREMIEGLEDDTDEDDSETERYRIYEVAQTHHGMEGLAAHRTQARELRRPRKPRETTQIPKLTAGLARLKDRIQQIEYEKARIEKRRADVRKERSEIVASQEHIQKSLEEAGQELDKISGQHLDGGIETNGYTHVVERGLESFGGTPKGKGME